MKPVTGFKLGSPELRAHQAQKTREQFARDGHPRGMLGKKHTLENLAKTWAGNRRYWETITSEQLAARNAQMIATRIARYGIGNAALRHTGFYTNARGGCRRDLGKRFFRSAWEANYARYLNYLTTIGMVRAWEYEPQTFVFPVGSDVRSYTPDFCVVEGDAASMPGWKRYHEIKGRWTDRFERQLDLIDRFYPHLAPMTIVDADDYRSLDRWVQRFNPLPNWERA